MDLTTTPRPRRRPRGRWWPAVLLVAVTLTGGLPGSPAQAAPVGVPAWIRGGPWPMRRTPALPPCAVPGGVTAPQILLVVSRGSAATVSGCVRSGTGYGRVLGPFPAWVGRRGTVAASLKREGDLRTPQGVFPLRAGFGTGADPGLWSGWLRVDGSDVWVDDPASRLYNTRQRKPARGRWRSAEDLAIPAYGQAQVIGWNEARTPGRGSAIFLHLQTGRPTAGCVSLAAGALRAVMVWQRSGAVIAIR